MVIRLLNPSILTCSTPFLRFGRIKIGGRGTIVKLSSGALAVFSPVALTPAVKDSMQSQLGTTDIRYITALDAEHHIFLESWHKAYPEAKILAPESLPSYRDKQGYFKIPEASWHLFKKADKDSLSVDAAFDKDFDMEFVDAHANKELVFNHRPTKTLIEADFLFNLPATEQHSRAGPNGTPLDPTKGILNKIFNAINHTRGDAIWQKRFLWYAISSSDRAGFNKSVAKIDKWDFDAIVPCHGDVIERGGKGVFQKVFGWHLAAAKKSS